MKINPKEADLMHQHKMQGLANNATLKDLLERVRDKGPDQMKAMQLLAAGETEKAMSLAGEIVGWHNCIKKLCNKLGITLKPKVQ